jgi:HEAT repeat protein
MATATSYLPDPDPAVRGAALGAISRLGGFDHEVMAAAMGDPDPGVRRRAVEIAGWSTSNFGPKWVVDLLNALGDKDDDVVEAGAWALGEVGTEAGQDAVDALSRVASEHPAALCREAAVAALGAIGHPSGLPHVLRALEDVPAIRRRAAVALAAFDDPSVRLAWQKCLTDKDRQVRYIAEDLLVDE